MSKLKIEIFTDGACRFNPGPGGWGVVLKYDGNIKYLKGAEAHTTNNRMELMAAIMGLRALTQPCQVDLTTDSKYVQKGITEWIHSWRKRQWRTSANQPVKNEDLWKLLDEELKEHEVAWHWIKGHSGHVENEKADELAREAIKQLVGSSS